MVRACSKHVAAANDIYCDFVWFHHSANEEVYKSDIWKGCYLLL